MSRRYCFTWNNYTDNDRVKLEAFYNEHCKYLVYGEEIGESGTPHLQGFFTCDKTKRLPALKKYFGNQVHFEVAKATSIRAAQYCKKGQQPHSEWEEEGPDGPRYGEDALVTEFGTPPTQGKRTDLNAVSAAIKEGTSIQAIAEEFPEQYIKFGRGIRDLKLVLEKPYNHDSLRGLWYVGPPGAGKSRKAREDNPDAYLKAQNKWFDGYNGEDVIILDDLDTPTLGHHLKIWADRYACTGETKGGTIHLRHKQFIVTSNYTIESLWPEDEEIQKALNRRFKVIKFSTPFNWMETDHN